MKRVSLFCLFIRLKKVGELVKTKVITSLHFPDETIMGNIIEVSLEVQIDIKGQG